MKGNQLVATIDTTWGTAKSHKVSDVQLQQCQVAQSFWCTMPSRTKFLMYSCNNAKSHKVSDVLVVLYSYTVAQYNTVLYGPYLYGIIRYTESRPYVLFPAVAQWLVPSVVPLPVVVSSPAARSFCTLFMWSLVRIPSEINFLPVCTANWRLDLKIKPV